MATSGMKNRPRARKRHLRISNRYCNRNSWVSGSGWPVLPYFQRAGGKRELTPYDCRSRGFRWPCPPQRHWPLVRLPFARTRAAKWHFRCAVVGCHLPPPSPHPTCAVWWCVWRLFAPVTPEVPQIHLDSEIAWLVLALAPMPLLGRPVSPAGSSTMLFAKFIYA